MSSGDGLDGLGERVRRFRLARGLTQRQLAARAEVTVPHVSRLESGERLPSLPMLATLAVALEVGLAELFDERSGPNPLAVVRRGAAGVEQGGMTTHALTGVGSTPGLVAARLEIAPERPAGDLVTHDGHNWLYVLGGTLRIDVREGSEVLRRGDCASFMASVPHRLVAEGRRPVALLVVGVVRVGRQ